MRTTRTTPLHTIRRAARLHRHARHGRRVHHALAAAALLALLPPAHAATYNWTSGSFVSGVTAPNPLAAGDVLNLLAGGTKLLNTAFTNNGTVNASDNLFFQNGNALSNAGTYALLGDFGMADGSGSGSFINSGVLRKSSGSGTSTIGIGFANNGGQIDVMSGTLAFSSGSTTFNAGTSFTGAGQALVNNNASFNGGFTSANLVLQAGSANGGSAVLTSGSVLWTGGSLTGNWQAGSGTVWTLQAGGTKNLNASFTNNGSVNASDTLFFQNGNSFNNNTLYLLQGDVGFADGGGNGAFVNNGTLRKTAGTASSIGTVGFVNNGVIDTQSGTMTFGSGSVAFNAGSQFIGAGSNVVSNSASFNGAFTSANLQLTVGNFTGNAAVINGTVVWTGGSLSGGWTLPAGQTMLLQTGATKNLNGTLTNSGSITASDTLFFQNGNALVNNGLYSVQGDVGLADGSGAGGFTNTGVFRKTSGNGVTTIANGSFTNNGGTIEAQTGSINFAAGSFNFNDGTLFKGPGSITVSNSATYAGAINSQTLVIAGGNQQGGNGGSGANASATLSGSTLWTGGSLTGSWVLASGQALNLSASGSAKLLNGSFLNNGTVSAASTLFFQNGNAFSNAATYVLQGDIGLDDGSGSGGLNNSGTFIKSGGTGTSFVSGVSFVNSGTITAQTGTINFRSGAASFNAGTVFNGAGQNVVSNNASFNGSFTASNLTLTAGQFNGGNAVLNGNVGWSGGSLTGGWQVAAGQTLRLQASASNKLLNGTLVNSGTITATDVLYLQNGNALTNNALFDVQADVGLADGSGSGSFINTGSFRKSAGSGSTTVAGVSFTNSGVIDARIGTIDFASGSANFNAGSQFTGAGQVVVSNNANFNGAFTASNLTLTGGQLNGGSAVLNGNVGWSGGTLTGSWQVAGGQTFNVQASAANKLLNGNLVNSGTVNASASIGLQNGNLLTNNGRYDAKGDVGFYDASGNGSVVNNGLFIKSGGTGTSDVSGINFVNNGVVDVTVGTIMLPANFNNLGRLIGAGTLSTNLITNTGHVAPGDGVGRLALSGNFVQAASGVFDVDITTLASHDLLAIGGAATLGGTLAVNCFAACSFAVGDLIEVLDYTGSRTGSFGSLTLSGFATGAFATIYDDANSRVLLQVTQAVTAAVPEPGTWTLMFGGLAAMVWVARRRRAA